MPWFRNLFARQRIFNDLREELEQHLAEKVDELMAEGKSREDAEYAAKRAFGNLVRIEERSREVWLWPAIDSLFADLWFSLRHFRKNPTVTLVALFSLGLGIGATTIMFSVIYAVLISPYPYQGSERMAHVHIMDKSGFVGDLALSSDQFRQFKNNSALDGAVAVDQWTGTITAGDLPESVTADYLSPNAFDVFGVPPLLGREFSEADTRDGSNPANVVVLSYPFWQTHYGGSTHLLGKNLQFDRKNFTIIGVMPKRFAWWPSGDLFFPLKFSLDSNQTAMVFVRTKPGVSPTVARAELTSSVRSLAKQTPDHFPKDFRVELVRLNDIFVGSFAGTLFFLFGAVGLLLSIGCANVSILLLASGMARRHELSVRAALGATRFRVVRQLLTESVLLSLAAGALGIVVAYGGVGFVTRLMPSHTFPGEASFQVNLPVLLFAISLALLAGIFFGVWPALRSTRRDLGHTLQAGSHKVAGSEGSIAAHTFLIAAQFSLIVILMAGAGATVRSLYALLHSPLGYDAHDVGAVTIPLRDGTYAQWEHRVAYFDQLRRRTEKIPGVLSVAIEQTNLPPVSTYKSSGEIRGSSDAATIFTIEQVSSNFFTTLHIPLKGGRLWTEAETAHGVRVGIVNLAMAQRYWPKGNVIGQMVHVDKLKSHTKWTLTAPGNDGWIQVVGVVGDTPNNGLRDPVSPAIYVPYTLVLNDGIDLVVRTSGDPLSYLRAIRQGIHEVDADQPIGLVTTAQERLNSEGLSGQKFVSTVFLSLACLGLALGSLGLYSVVSYVVSQRAREFGIRMALGASRAHVMQIVVRSTATAVAVGGCVGLATTLILNRLVAHWAQGDVRDPLMLTGVVTALMLVVAIASLVPAQRAASIDPVQALRTE